MSLGAPRSAFPILILYFFLLAPCVVAQYSSLPPGEDHPILGSGYRRNLERHLKRCGPTNLPTRAATWRRFIGPLLATRTQTFFLGFTPHR